MSRAAARDSFRVDATPGAKSVASALSQEIIIDCCAFILRQYSFSRDNSEAIVSQPIWHSLVNRTKKREEAMIHPLVTQLHFTRSEFVRCFEGVPPGDACRRPEPMNCLSWIVGHLAWQEHFFWVEMAQGQNIAPGLRQLTGTGQPASTPPWDEMWALWHAITKTADIYLCGLQAEELKTQFVWEGKPITENVGTLLLRNIYHYWFHLGKAHAIRQMLGHTGLAGYVGNMSSVRFAVEE